MDFSRRENVEKVLRLLQESREEPRADALTRLRSGVLLRNHGAPMRKSRSACASICGRWSTRTTTGAPPGPAPRSGWPIRATRTPTRTVSPPSNVGHTSKLQPDDEGIEDIHGEVVNSHSLVKTIGTVFGAYQGRGGATIEDLPQKAAE